MTFLLIHCLLLLFTNSSTFLIPPKFCIETLCFPECSLEPLSGNEFRRMQFPLVDNVGCNIYKLDIFQREKTNNMVYMMILFVILAVVIGVSAATIIVHYANAASSDSCS